MKFNIYGEKVNVNENVQNKIESRLSDLNKYIAIDEKAIAKITVKTFSNSLKVEISVPSKVGLLRSEIVHDNFETAIDLGIDKIEDQIRRQKGRLSRRHKDSISKSFYEENNDKDIPVKTKTVYADEMILDEAIMQMEMLSHNFYIYKDADSEKIAVVYKRNDGGYGLIEVSD